MRELFDVFLDLRKTQDYEGRPDMSHPGSVLSSLGISPSSEYMTLNRRTIREEPCSTQDPPRQSKPYVDLLDLEVELNSMNQKPEKKSNSNVSKSVNSVEDPFGDSFSPPPNNQKSTINKLPPPPSSKEFHSSRVELSNLAAALPPVSTEEHWFDKETKGMFDNDLFGESAQDVAASAKSFSKSDNLFDVFTELDPLGTGRVKPYVDKKDFFSDLKNPPKQVLNDLVPRDVLEFESAHVREQKTSMSFDSTDPFNNIDPFETDPLPSMTSFEDAFDTPFADFSSFDRPIKQNKTPLFSSNMGPLQVTLPPENRTPVGSPSLSKNRKLRTTKSGGKLSSPKMKTRFPHPDDETRQSPIMEGVYLRGSRDTPSPTYAPEPPPRPAITCYSIKPPPLPPKKQSPSVMPRPASRHSDYDYIQNYETLPPSAPSEAPPLPVPVRKPKLSLEYDSSYVPQRPKKSSISSASIESDYYLTPNNFTTSNLVNKTSLDMTLSQLTKTGFSELALALSMSPTALSKLTIGELTEYIASLSKEDMRTTCDAIKDDEFRRKSNAFADDNSPFEPDFEGKFSNEPSLYDKYAVFRELVEEKPPSLPNEPFLPQVDMPPVTPQETKRNSVLNNQQLEDRYAALRDICIDEATGQVSDKDSNNEESKKDGYKTLDDEMSYMQLNNVKFKSDREDSPNDIDDKTSYTNFTRFNGEDQVADSDKEEDSVAEELQTKEEDEEGRDLLDVSRPQSYSESTESPTTIFKEPQCVIESTIVEEEDVDNVSPLETDKDKHKESTNWACFDDALPRKPDIGPTKEVTNTSPWPSTEEGELPINESLPKSPSSKTNKINKTRSQDTQWTDLEKPDIVRKDHVRQRQERSWEWEENGHSWSDEENDDDDDEDDNYPQYTRERKFYEKRDRRRKPSPWSKSSRDPSPWQETEPELPDWETSNRPKPKIRGVSASMDDRKSELRKKGASPWSIDTSWDEKERYQRRKQSEERRRRYRDDPEYGRRDRRSDSSWKPSSSRYHREAKESPWDDEYLESDDMSPRPRHSHTWKTSAKKYEPYSSYNESEDEVYVKKHYPSRNYSEQDDKKDRYTNRKYYKGHEDERSSRRRRYSQDEVEDRSEGIENFNRRKAQYSGDGSEDERPFRRKPYSQDELSESDMDQHYTRRSQTLHFNKQRPKQRRPSKSSPFEDDFIPSSASHFEFPEVKPKKSGGSSSHPSPDLKPKSCDTKCCLKSPDVTARQHTQNIGSPLETPNLRRVSPFEDDFTSVASVDIKKTSGRSGNSSFSESESVFLSTESNKNFPDDRIDSQMKKSDSINIFKQEDDPFEDDEFFQKTDMGEDDTMHKWKKAFDSFNFEDANK